MVLCKRDVYGLTTGCGIFSNGDTAVLYQAIDVPGAPFTNMD